MVDVVVEAKTVGQDTELEHHCKGKECFVTKPEGEEYFGLVEEKVREIGNVGLQDDLEEVWQEAVPPQENAEPVLPDPLEDELQDQAQDYRLRKSQKAEDSDGPEKAPVEIFDLPVLLIRETGVVGSTNFGLQVREGGVVVEQRPFQSLYLLDSIENVVHEGRVVSFIIDIKP